MKYRILLITLLIFSIFACSDKDKNQIKIDPNTCLPEGWNPIDSNLIYSYFTPLKDNSKVSYISEKGDVEEFIVDYSRCEYINTFCYDLEPLAEKYHIEQLDIYIAMKSENNHLIYHFLIDSRSVMLIEVSLNYDIFARSEVTWTTNNKGYSTEPDGYIDFFKEGNSMLIPSPEDSSPKASFEKDKGLTWFIDKNGVKWTLKN